MGEELRKTPLWDHHHRGGARMVGFAGWDMPIQYSTGQIKEHEIVRTDAGVFDVSHMARFWVRGPGAVPFVNGLITNDLEKAAPGQLIYSPMCLETGGVVDDVTVYRFDMEVLVVANASNKQPVWDWLVRHKPADVTLVDRSDELAQLAVQGPRAQERMKSLVKEDLDPVGYYRHGWFTLLGKPDVLISRNGYTGEDGFEVYLPAVDAGAFFGALLENGVRPIGLAARDTLRFEMCYALYGQELDRETTPLEAGLGWTVKLKKAADFIGKQALVREKQEGLRKTLVGFEVKGPRAARHGQTILHEGKPIGVVTSGGPCPSLGNKGMGLGFVRSDLTAAGTTLSVDVRGAMVEVTVVERPFYKTASHR
jgi:aminomethyltransferase